MHDNTEMCLMTKATMQAALDFLYDLAGAWQWKRNTIPKNDALMAELDLLIARIEQRLEPSNGQVRRDSAAPGGTHGH